MKRIKRKLHSQGGASFLLALMAFLVAAMVSVTIVFSASTGMKRVYDDREREQAHLTLISAAQFLREEMKGSVYTREVVEKTLEAGENTQSVKRTVIGNFSKEIEAAVTRVETTSSKYQSSEDALKIEAEGMKKVKVSYVMESGTEENGEELYKLIFTFSLEDSGEQLFLTLRANKSPESSTTTEDGLVTRTTTVEWNQPIINGLGE